MPGGSPARYLWALLLTRIHEIFPLCLREMARRLYDLEDLCFVGRGEAGEV